MNVVFAAMPAFSTASRIVFTALSTPPQRLLLYRHHGLAHVRSDPRLPDARPAKAGLYLFDKIAADAREVTRRMPGNRH